MDQTCLDLEKSCAMMMSLHVLVNDKHFAPSALSGCLNQRHVLPAHRKAMLDLGEWLAQPETVG